MDANQLIIVIAQMKWLKVVGVGLLAAALYYPIFDDGRTLQDQVNQLQQQYAEQEKDIAATKEALANADRFEREVKDAVDQFTHITDFMPEKIGGSDLIFLVTSVCKQTGVKLLKIEPRPPGDKVEFYDTARVAFNIEGTFAQILDFLSNLSKIPKLMTIDDFVLELGIESSNQESPLLIASGVLLGYRYVKPVPQAAQSTDEKTGEANGSSTPKVNQ